MASVTQTIKDSFTHPDPNAVQRRVVTYAVMTAVLFVLSLFAFHLSWQSSELLHTALETIAATIALFVGLMALSRYYSQRMDNYLVIGVGFL